MAEPPRVWIVAESSYGIMRGGRGCENYSIASDYFTLPAAEKISSGRAAAPSSIVSELGLC
jgi:hypothetical protein